jgi:hypothetical protein
MTSRKATKKEPRDEVALLDNSRGQRILRKRRDQAFPHAQRHDLPSGRSRSGICHDRLVKRLCPMGNVVIWADLAFWYSKEERLSCECTPTER